MATKSISITQIGGEIADLMSQYSDDVEDEVEKEVNKTGKLILADVRRLAPKGRTGDYAKSFAIKITRNNGNTERAIYNKKAGLVHLLEKGHVKKNQYGTYGHTTARPHLVPAYNKYADKMYSNIRRIIGG